MADPNALDFLRIPSGVLVALDWRPYHFALQPYHYIVRITHVVSMAGFFGGIAALDLRLMGWRVMLPLRPFADQVLPWLYFTFGIAIVSGFALFFYDPVHVGSHAYFTLKLLLTALGLVNAALFRRSGYLAALASSRDAGIVTALDACPNRRRRFDCDLDRRGRLCLPQCRGAAEGAASVVCRT